MQLPPNPEPSPGHGPGLHPPPPQPVSGSTQDMIAEEDPDGDGIVTKEEFTKMLERKKTDSPNIQ